MSERIPDLSATLKGGPPFDAENGPPLDAESGPLVRKRLPMSTLRSIALRFGAVGLNAVSGILTARALHPDGRGHLAAMVIWPMLLAGLTTFGLPSALVYHLRREPERRAQLVAWGLLLTTLGAIVGTSIGWFVIPLWLADQPEHIRTAAQLCLLTTWLCSVTLLGRAAWEAQGHFERSNVSQVLTPLMAVVAIVALMATGRLTPISAAAAYVLAGLPSLVWILASVVRTSRPTFAGETNTWRPLLHYGGRSYGVDLCGFLAIYLDQALVVGLLSPASMGIYAVALSLSRVLGAVHGVVASIVFPRVVGMSERELSIAVARSGRMGTIASGAIGAVILAAGPSLLHWLYGPAFGAASVILPILVVEAIVVGLAYVLSQGFLAAGRPGIATMTQMGSLVLSVPIFLIVVPAYGVVGAAAALLASSSMRLAFTLIAYKTVLRVPVPRIVIDGRDLSELTHYRSSLVSSIARFRAAGGVE